MAYGRHFLTYRALGSRGLVAPLISGAARCPKAHDAISFKTYFVRLDTCRDDLIGWEDRADMWPSKSSIPGFHRRTQRRYPSRARKPVEILTGVDAGPCRDHDHVTMLWRRTDSVM